MRLKATQPCWDLIGALFGNSNLSSLTILYCLIRFSKKLRRRNPTSSASSKLCPLDTSFWGFRNWLWMILLWYIKKRKCQINKITFCAIIIEKWWKYHQQFITESYMEFVLGKFYSWGDCLLVLVNTSRVKRWYS